MPIEPTQEVNENSSCQLQFELVDQNDSAIPVSSIGTAYLTLRDKYTSAIINSRNTVDVKTYFDTAGNFDMFLSSADNIVYANSNNYYSDIPHEYHIATITITVPSGGNSLQLVEEIFIKVLNLRKT